MLGHKSYPSNLDRWELLSGFKNRMETDGYSNISDGSVKYERVNIAFKPLYTWILVDLKYFANGGTRKHHRKHKINVKKSIEWTK